MVRLRTGQCCSTRSFCVVAMEASGGTHYWAREMQRIDHYVCVISSSDINRLGREKVRRQSCSLRHTPSRTVSPDHLTAGNFRCFQRL